MLDLWSQEPQHHTASWLAHADINSVMLATALVPDAFLQLTPEPVRGTPNEPANVAHIARFAAGLFGVDEEELARVTTANAMEFYGLQPQ